MPVKAGQRDVDGRRSSSRRRRWTRRAAAVPAAVPGRRQHPGDAHGRASAQRGDRRPATTDRAGRLAEPPAHLRLSARAEPPSNAPSARRAQRRAGCARTILSTLARRAYRRPVTDADLEPLLAFYRGGRAQGGLRRRHRARLEPAARQPGVPVPRRARSGERRSRTRRTASAISSWPRGCRSSCGAAFPTTSCSTLAAKGQLKDAGGARRSRCGGCWPTRGPKRSSRTSPASGCTCATCRRRCRSQIDLPGLRRQPAPGVPARDGAVLRQHRPRGSQRARAADAPTTRS